MEWGYDSERGKRALRRMNQLHGRFDIANEDFLYVLSTFIYEPIRWNERFGWRPMCEQERLGVLPLLARGRPAHEHPGHSGRLRGLRAVQSRLRAAALPLHRGQSAGRQRRRASMFVGWFPRAAWRRWCGRPSTRMLDDPLLEAFGFPRPSPAMRWLVAAGLRMRGRLVRSCGPAGGRACGPRCGVRRRTRKATPSSSSGPRGHLERGAPIPEVAWRCARGTATRPPVGAHVRAVGPRSALLRPRSLDGAHDRVDPRGRIGLTQPPSTR